MKCIDVRKEMLNKSLAINVDVRREMPVSLAICVHVTKSSGVPRNFARMVCSTNSVEDRENGNLGAVAL